jgi:hypothetical protein
MTAESRLELVRGMDGFAVVAGVSNYQRIRSLPSVSDVQDVARVLGDPLLCAYPPPQIEVLDEAQATRSALLAALDRLRDTARPASSVFIYFSGHGGQVTEGALADSYLMPHDGTWRTPEELARTAISGKELTERLRGITAKRVTVVLDCCRAAGLLEAKGESESALDSRLSTRTLATLAQGRGRAVFAASRADGASYSVEGRRNSVFTQHLLAGLRGAAPGTGGVIRVCDLFHYIQQQVSAELPDQHPVFKAELEENYPLVAYRGGHAPPLQLLAARDGCTYDAFVSYRRSAPDKAWVEQLLVPKLEALGLRICLAHRDFTLGAPRIREMTRAVQSSRYTLAVLSSQYLADAFQEFQTLLAQHQAIESGAPRFIPLLREDCDLPLDIRVTERLDVSEAEFEEATVLRLAQRLREPYHPNQGG